VTTLDDLKAAVPAVEEWVDDLMHRLAWHDRKRAFLALVTSLHALRDCLGRDEAVYVGAQLPPLLRGLYYEGWHPSGRSVARHRDSFLKRVHEGMHRDPAIDAQAVVSGVLALLAARLPAVEVENAKAATPGDLLNLWPS
jgi:uncharacterized protein (DUF2267 family)